MRGVIILRRWKDPPQDSTPKTLKEGMSRYARHDRKEKRRFLGLKPSERQRKKCHPELISSLSLRAVFARSLLILRRYTNPPQDSTQKTLKEEIPHKRRSG